MAALAIAACDQGRRLVGTLGELHDVRQRVIEATGHDNVVVNLASGGHLTISIVNSPLKELPPDQKKAKARAIARVAHDALPSRAALVRVGVVFVSQRRQFLIVTVKDGRDHHAFSPADLRAGTE